MCSRAYENVSKIEGGMIVNQKALIEFIAILNKLQVQSDPSLTDAQKEICKYCIDELKKKVQ